jgi:hypothetical protein
MAFPACTLCDDLQVDKNGDRLHLGLRAQNGWFTSFMDLQSSARRCQSGGCGIILQAISTVCLEEPVSKTASLSYSQSGGFSIYDRQITTYIRLFTTQGR